MKVSQSAPLQLDSVATVAGKADLGGTPVNAPTQRRALVGGGWITTQAVAAHVRKKMMATRQPATTGVQPQEQVVKRVAMIGGGWIATPSVAAHARKKMTGKDRHSTE